LEALMVRVWIDGKTAHLDGVLPIPGEVRAMSQPLSLLRHNINFNIPFAIPIRIGGKK